MSSLFPQVQNIQQATTPKLPSIDGTAEANCTGTLTCSVTLSTTNMYDFIAFIISAYNTTAPAVSDGLGMSWLRISPTVIGNPKQVTFGLWTFRAIASTTLSLDSITVTYSMGQTVQLVAFGVTGVNSAAPTDATAAQTTNFSHGTNSAPTATFTTTTQPYEFLFAVASNQTRQTNLGPGSGWTEISGITTTPDVEYKTVTTAQTNAVATFGSGSLVAWSAGLTGLVSVNPTGPPQHSVRAVQLDGSMTCDMQGTVCVVTITTVNSDDTILFFAQTWGSQTFSLGGGGFSPVSSAWKQRARWVSPCAIPTLGNMTMTEYYTTTGPPGVYSFNATQTPTGSFQARLVAFSGILPNFVSASPFTSCQPTGPVASPTLTISDVSGLVVAIEDGNDLGTGQTNCGGATSQGHGGTFLGIPTSGWKNIPWNLTLGSADYPGVEDGSGGEYKIVSLTRGATHANFTCNCQGWDEYAEVLALPLSPIPGIYSPVPLPFIDPSVIYITGGVVAFIVTIVTVMERTRKRGPG